MSAHQHQVPFDDASMDLVYFFIPLVEPLALPDQYCQEFVERLSFEEWSGYVNAGHDVPYESVKRLVSLMFRQTRIQDVNLLGLGPALQVAADAFPSLPKPTDSLAPPEPPTFPKTVVEAAVELLPFEGHSPSVGILSEALDIALQCIRQMQRSYRAAKGRPITLITRERLPPWVPMALRLGVQPGESSSWPTEFALFEANQNFQEVVDQEVEAGFLDLLASAHDATEDGRAFSRYLDFVREAQTSLRQRGDYKIAVVLAATASEIFLDDLLMHLLWEERRRPEEVASMFEQGLAGRVQSYFHGRLGGQWSFERPGPVQVWHRQLAALRHRIVHAGHEPTKLEAEAAIEALFALQAFVLQRIVLKQQLIKYPRTAVVLLGRQGLAKRRKLTAEIETLTNDPNEPVWAETFRRWRHVVAACRIDPADRVKPQPGRAVTIAVIGSTGAVSWWLHDRVANLMCAGTHPDLSEEHRHEMTKLTKALTGQPIEPIAVSFGSATLRPVEPVSWVFPYHVLPMAGVMVDGSDLDLI